jgi:FAD/FMN-containing dehydrogenase
MPYVKINSFGHIGDGNIHYNLSPPEGQKSFNNTEKEFAYELGKLVTKMGGSFAAEHGIGRSKIELTDLLRDPVERELMRKIKKSIDKKNNLNPDVLISIN